nr:C-GCAxxG-C-C family protein [Bacteroidota bacterium]
MKEKITRSDFVKKSAILFAGVTGVGLGAGLLASKKAEAEVIDRTEWPWPYATLDAEEVRILAHDSFWGGFACSAGAFHAIITKLHESLGDPYTDFPTKMMVFGHGGSVGWGTLCGALNGAAAAISLVCEKADSDQLIHELNGWYTQAQFPSTISNTYATSHLFNHNDFDMELPQSDCGSPLCHVSVTKWCNDAAFGVGANERKERCARLAGDVAAKAVELLNEHFAGTFTGTYVPPESIASCLACHGSGGTQNNVAAKLDCVSCHTDDPHSGAIFESGSTHDRFEVKQNFPNPFYSETSIEFSILNASKVTLEVYNLNGQHVKTLISNQQYGMGNHTVVWDGTNEHGNKAKGGMYIYRLMVNKKMMSRNMMKI